jgi:hypothetical protein
MILMSTNLAKKLGIKPGDRVAMVAAPPGMGDYLRPELSPGVLLAAGLPEERCEVILFWPKRLGGLEEKFRDLQNRIVPDGAIWAVMPKKKFVAKWDIDYTWEQMQAAGLQTDLVDNKVASVDDETYGTRFVIRRDRRQLYSA